jgi:glutathione synthase
MTRHLFVADPLGPIRIDQDSTFGLMLEGQNRGHEVHWCSLNGLIARDGDGFARAQAATVRAVQGDHFTLAPAQERPLGDFATIWMRKDPPFDMTYVAATWILDLAPPGTRVVNRPQGLRDWNEKCAVLRFPDFAPRCLVSRDMTVILDFCRAVGSTVIKPLGFSGGAGIVALHPGDLNTRSLIEISTHSGQRFILVQQYMPEITEGDKRVIMVNGVTRGALLRVPPSDDLRGNIHVGARVEFVGLTDAEQLVCDALEVPLREAGHVFVGIDLIGEKLTEVNVTSPTGIREIQALGGPDIGKELMDAALRSP